MIGIDQSLYESAAIDGAGTVGMIRYITLPQLKGVIVIMGLLSLGGIFTSKFGLFYQVPRNSGAILSATETVDVYIYKALMDQANYGFSAAGSLLQNGIGCALLLLADFAVRHVDREGEFVRVLDPMYRDGRYDSPGRKGKVRMEGNEAIALLSVISQDCMSRPYFLFSRREESK